MRALIDGCARHPVVPNLLMLCLIALGVWSFLSLRVEVNPEVAKDEIEVVVPYPGAPPAEVEEAIVVKIEQALRGTPGVRRVGATAREGMARVVAELEEGVDDRRAVLDDVRTRVGLITTFPEDALDPIVSDVVFASMALQLVLHGDAPERTLREVALDLRDELGRRGVSTVQLTGIRDYEIAIEVSRRDLESYGLDLGDVTEAVRRGSINLPGGSVRTGDEEYKIEVRGRRYTGQEFENLMLLARDDGTIVRLGDVARVIDGFEETERIGRYAGERAVILNLMRVGDEDTIRVARTGRELVDQAGALLPEGLRLAVLGDFSVDLVDRIDMLITNGWQGLLLVFLALWAFLELRLAFWVAVGIPTAFAFAGIVLAVFDQSLNMINLFGLILVLGIVVDDGIVIGENIHTHQRRRPDDPMGAAVAGAHEMAWPIIAAVATTIVAFLPLFFVAGLMGKFIAVLPVVVIAVLIGSTVDGFCILPGHLGHRRARPGPLARIGAPVRRALDGLMDAVILRLYGPLYRLSLRARYATVALAFFGLCVTAGLIAGGMVPFVLFPASDTLFLRAEVSFPEGTPLAVTRAAVDRLEEAAWRVDAAHGGAAEGGGGLISGIYAEAGGEGATSNRGLVYVTLVPPEARTLRSFEIINLWREEAGPIPNALRLLYSGIGGAGLPTKDIELFLSGGDIGALREAATAVQAALATYDGVFDVESDLYPGKRELRITLTPAGRTLGLTLQDVAQQLRSGFFGDEALKVQRGRDEVIVRVRLPPEERGNLEGFFGLRVRTPAGHEVPLSEVAQVELGRGVAEIRRRDGRRQAGVTAAVDKTRTTPGEILADFRATKEPEIRAAFPAVKIAYEGANRETAESVRSLTAGFAVALFGLYAVLALVFRSYVQPLLILVTIPLGVIGAVVGHYLLGYQLTMLSLFGIVALAGVVVNGAIVLIETINVAHRAGAGVEEAVERAGPQRFRPIFLTTATTVAGLMPLLAERSFQAQFLKPMALSLAAGLIFATLLTLFVVPCLYLILNDARRLGRWLLTGAWPGREAAAGAAGGHDD